MVAATVGILTVVFSLKTIFLSFAAASVNTAASAVSFAPAGTNIKLACEWPAAAAPTLLYETVAATVPSNSVPLAIPFPELLNVSPFSSSSVLSDFPARSAVITLAVKLPDASRATIALAVLLAVAVVALFDTLPAVLIVASLVSTIPAAALMSALTIVPSTILALATVMPLGSAPGASLFSGISSNAVPLGPCTPGTITASAGCAVPVTTTPLPSGSTSEIVF